MQPYMYVTFVKLNSTFVKLSHRKKRRVGASKMQPYMYVTFVKLNHRKKRQVGASKMNLYIFLTFVKLNFCKTKPSKEASGFLGRR
jgi:hypothetical protein